MKSGLGHRLSKGSYPFSRELGWSHSRYEKFTTCRRQYWYSYYGKHDREFGRARIDKLKNLTSVAIEKGTVVHDVIEALFKRLQKTAEPINRERMTAFSEARVREVVRNKRFGRQHYEGTPVGIDEMLPDVRSALDNLMSSPRLEWLMNDAVRFAADWIIEPSNYGETRINGLKAYCKVDFLVPMEDELHILDWKTGRKDVQKHRRQLIGYAGWARQELEPEFGAVIPIVVYLLPEYEEYVVELSEFEMESFSKTVAEQAGEMKSCCVNVVENTPKPKSEFPMTENLQSCRWCNFRELCY